MIIIFSIVWFSLGYASLALLFYVTKMRLDFTHGQKMTFMEVAKSFISLHEPDPEHKITSPEVTCLLCVGTGPVSLLTNTLSYRQLKKEMKNKEVNDD